ncbi:abortive infection family protein [Desulfosporosinus sp. Sb-LF]|uniref:abortive infection family protein n=1 Tax=Desulfosporosinus sp. Sb-LF TaxID=2560027 RepID=UPI00107EF20A|nr:abortive infection family protein [Desulfosporosinus sp. Sb-LF]TGE31345.1 abortive phage infection protein [Desulfosporosinus sp. Sb-LF]
MMNELYKLLKNKEIISILDGDKTFGQINDVQISMPYLSGPDLCALSTTFGLPVEYGWNGGALSRWMYLDNLLEYCINNNKMQQLLSCLFAKNKFIDKLKNLTTEEIEETYAETVNTLIKQISGILYFSGNEFTLVNKQFIVKPINAIVEVEAPTIKVIDSAYIKGLSERALVDIDNSNYDSAITKCRTLLEEVFCYVIELKNEKPSENGDIGSLYKQVKDLYDMHQSKDIDKRINMLLSGLEKILTAISQMRNNDSDAHGVGSKRIRIQDHHARLFLNASIMMSDFILAVAYRKD